MAKRFELLMAVACWLCASSALGQTWVGQRSTPNLGELVAVDETGEDGWPFGAEDVLDDGLDAFQQQEQSLDVRTVYAATNAQVFWVRAYVSDTNAPGGNVSVYVFVDNDLNANTGGTAVAPEVDMGFTSDPSPGGYEYVLGIDGNESVSGVWEYDAMADEYAPLTLQAADATAEVGTDTDPILFNGDEHGYLQGSFDLPLVGLTAACNANLFVRSVSNQGMPGQGDRDVGLVARCQPDDDDDDGVPDIVVVECRVDDDCPANGICDDGDCYYPRACVTMADCGADEDCVGGRCVVTGGDDCTTDAMCDGLVCDDGTCMPCTTDAMCGAERCGPDGRCTGASGSAEDRYELEPDEEVQGGALTCVAGPWRTAGSKAATSSTGNGAWVFLSLLSALGLAWRMGRRSSR